MSKITATVTRGATGNPPPGMQNMDAWTVQLQYKGRRMTIPFYMGYGHGGAQPTTAEVLESLTADAAIYENVSSVEDFANELGYDLDNPSDLHRVQKVYVGVERNTRKLRQFFGEDYDAAMYTEGWLEAHTE